MIYAFCIVLGILVMLLVIPLPQDNHHPRDLPPAGEPNTDQAECKSSNGTQCDSTCSCSCINGTCTIYFPNGMMPLPHKNPVPQDLPPGGEPNTDQAEFKSADGTQHDSTCFCSCINGTCTMYFPNEVMLLPHKNPVPQDLSPAGEPNTDQAECKTADGTQRDSTCNCSCINGSCTIYWPNGVMPLPHKNPVPRDLSPAGEPNTDQAECKSADGTQCESTCSCSCINGTCTIYFPNEVMPLPHKNPVPQDLPPAEEPNTEQAECKCNDGIQCNSSCFCSCTTGTCIAGPSDGSRPKQILLPEEFSFHHCGPCLDGSTCIGTYCTCDKETGGCVALTNCGDPMPGITTNTYPDTPTNTSNTYSYTSTSNTYPDTTTSTSNTDSHTSTSNTYPDTATSTSNTYSYTSTSNTYPDTATSTSNTYSYTSTSNTYPDTATSNTYPDTATSNTYPDTATSNTYPDTATSNTYPDTVTSNTYPDTATSNTYPDTATSNTYPDTATSNTYPDTATSNTYPATATSNTYPATATSNTYPDTTTSNKYPDTATSNTYPDTATSNTYPDTATSNTYPDTATSNTYPVKATHPPVSGHRH